MRQASWLVELFWLTIALPLSAQQYTHLSGLVLDSSGATIPGATITAANEGTGFRRTTMSQADGGYVIAYLQPGVYRMTAHKAGFSTLIRFGIKLDVAQPARIDFHLPLNTLQETITVEGALPLLNSEDASVGTLVRRGWVDRLPLNGRGVLGLLELAPGAVITPANAGEAGQFTVSGQRPNTNYFIIDGVSLNTGVSGSGAPGQFPGGSLPNMSALGSLHTLLSVDALEELRIETSTSTPEIGRFSGAQVSVSSRSGSNDWHGSLMQYFRNEKLDANDWFANRHGDARAPLRLLDVGASLGGPIRHNRTFFFADYEGLRLRQPYTWQGAVPSATARQTGPAWLQDLLSLFPTPNGSDLNGGLSEWTGHIARPSRLDVGNVRLDHALSSHAMLFARYTEAPSSTEYGAPQANHVDFGWHSATIGLNVAGNPHLTQDLRINVSHAGADSAWSDADGSRLSACRLAELVFPTAPPCNALLRVYIGGIGQLLSGGVSRNTQGQINIVETLTWNRGAHLIRFGGDYRRLMPVRRGATTSINTTATSLAGLLTNQRFTIATSDAGMTRSLIEESSIFLQDTWRLDPRLTITYGLRWELDPAPTARPGVLGLTGSTLPQITSNEQPIWHFRYTNLAPRVGVAYRLRTDGQTVLRAGFGIYYDPEFGVATDGINGGPFNTWQFHNGGPTPGSPVPFMLTYGFAKDLRIPMIRHWNVSLERAWHDRDIVSLGYVGASGHNLLRRDLGDPQGDSLVSVALATNEGRSDYHALQFQYRHRLGYGVQSLLSYAWSHSIDNGSTDSALFWTIPGLGPDADRGSSDFDARSVFTAAVSYDLRHPPFSPRWQRIFSGWSLDGILHARTGFPINILHADEFLSLSFANAFRPDLVPGAPIWTQDANSPAGRRLNPAAFTLPESFAQGTLGRNAIRGFGMSQVDVAIHRDFTLNERSSIQLRAEMFNALNQANFSDPVRFLSDPYFGQSTALLNLMLGSGHPNAGLTPAFQTGGPRSVQLALRFRF